MNDCPKPVEIYVLGRRYPHKICGCGNCGRQPTPEQLQREVEEWLWREYAKGAQNH